MVTNEQLEAAERKVAVLRDSHLKNTKGGIRRFIESGELVSRALGEAARLGAFSSYENYAIYQGAKNDKTKGRLVHPVRAAVEAAGKAIGKFLRRG